MSIQFCCQPFNDLINRAGQKGPAIIVVKRSPNQLRFRLQSRGVAHQDEADIKTMSIPIKINLSMTVGLNYCPFCGRYLQEMLEATPAEYEELATKHMPLTTTAT
jgi:hypothetical protein